MSYNFLGLKNRFSEIENWLSTEYKNIHTGTASPAILDSIMILAYGIKQPLKNVASINVDDPRTLRVAPWDKNQLKEIEKAIVEANLGLSVATGDAGVRVIFPQLTEESRTKLAKMLKVKLEDARVSVRKEREAVIDDIEKQKKDGTLGEDDMFRHKDNVQKLVDETNTALETIFAKKEADVMRV